MTQLVAGALAASETLRLKRCALRLRFFVWVECVLIGGVGHWLRFALGL